MAYETGTATDHQDLYDKLIEFLTTNADLVADDQQWANPWTSGDQVVLVGPGLAEDAEIYVGLDLRASVDNDEFWIAARGMTGYLSDATDISDHVNSSPEVRMFLDNSPMTYWFVASGRRFVVVTKVSTVYEALYGGWTLPYAQPTTYPYPMFIGASAGRSTGSQEINDWRSTLAGHAHFCYPNYSQVSGSSNTVQVSSYLLDPSGNWLRCESDGDTIGISDINPPGLFIGIGPKDFGTGFEAFSAQLASSSVGGGRYGYESLRQVVREAFGGQMPLTPFTLNLLIVDGSTSTPVTVEQTFGILDGVFHVPGFNNTPESVVSIDAVDYICIPNVFRNGVGDFWALRLS